QIASLPARNPGEGQQPRALNLPIHTPDGERPASHANAAHEPATTGAKIGLHTLSLEPPLRTPPLHSLLRVGQGIEHALGGCLDRDLLRHARARLIHRSSSRYFFRPRRVSF